MVNPFPSQLPIKKKNGLEKIQVPQSKRISSIDGLRLSRKVNKKRQKKKERKKTPEIDWWNRYLSERRTWDVETSETKSEAVTNQCDSINFNFFIGLLLHSRAASLSSSSFFLFFCRCRSVFIQSTDVALPLQFHPFFKEKNGKKNRKKNRIRCHSAESVLSLSIKKKWNGSISFSRSPTFLFSFPFFSFNFFFILGDQKRRAVLGNSAIGGAIEKVVIERIWSSSHCFGRRWAAAAVAAASRRSNQ